MLGKYSITKLHPSPPPVKKMIKELRHKETKSKEMELDLSLGLSDVRV
jgi:hypothetical protein